MPVIRLLASLNVAGASRRTGEEVAVEGEVASYLVGQGLAELARGEQSVTPERTPPPERAGLARSGRATRPPERTIR